MTKVELELTIIENDEGEWEAIIKPKGDANESKAAWTIAKDKQTLMDQVREIFRHNGFYFSMMK